MGLNSTERAIKETELREFQSQLTCAQIRAEYSLRMEGVVGEKFKASQKAMTNQWLERVTIIRNRIAGIEKHLLTLTNNTDGGN